MRISTRVILSCALLGSAVCTAQKYFPNEHMYMDTSLRVFVSDLKSAVELKDPDFIYQHLDAEVVFGLEGDSGISGFMEKWEVRNPESRFWIEMKSILELGGTVLSGDDDTERQTVVFPYTYLIELPVESDYTGTGIISDFNVAIHKSPSHKSPVITKLTYELIEYMKDENQQVIISGQTGLSPDWYKVQTPDHQTQGWVFYRNVFSLMGPVLFLYKSEAGQWTISTYTKNE